MKIIVDKREKTPYTFSRYPDVEVIRDTLFTGDYSLARFEGSIALERKTLNDLIGCFMGEDRDRFERELNRGRGMDFFAVIVEASFADIHQRRYRSNMLPQAAVETIIAFTVRYKTNFFFAGNQQCGEAVAHSLLSKYLREFDLKYRELIKHQRQEVG